MSQASDQITEYLSVGGLFNPEFMNQTQHEAVRDTLINARDEIQQLERENAALRKTIDAQADYQRELRADRDRLDWLLTKASVDQMIVLTSDASEARKAIDSAMGVSNP